MQSSVIHFRLEIFRKATLHCVFYWYYYYFLFSYIISSWALPRLWANHLNIDPHTPPSRWMQILHLHLPADERHQVAFSYTSHFSVMIKKQWRATPCVLIVVCLLITPTFFFFFNCTPRKALKRKDPAVREQGLWRLTGPGLGEWRLKAFAHWSKVAVLAPVRETSAPPSLVPAELDACCMWS